jgi:hypothetical protein
MVCRVHGRCLETIKILIDIYILKFSGLNLAYAKTISVSVDQEVYDQRTESITKDHLDHAG